MAAAGGEVATAQAVAVDEEGLRAFCRREHPRLVGAVGLYVGDRAVAEELAQEALLRACLRWDRVGGLDKPGAWVHRVAMNLASSHLRRRARGRQLAARLVEPDAGAERDLASAVAVRRAVAALPDRQRQALVLRYFADMPVDEVAEVMGCPGGTVKSLVSRAIDGLRAAGLEVEA